MPCPSSLHSSPVAKSSIPAAASLLSIVLLAGSAFAGGTTSDPGPFAAGRRDVTVTRPDGSTFTATLHYPATTAGVNAPFDPSGGPYPVFSFGHGFLSAVTLYQSTLAHLASHGFFAIASQSQGGLFPNHAAFATDIRHCLDHLIAANASASSPYFGSVAVEALAVGGHSMGGGASILSAAADPRIRAVVTLAAANTNPSSISAAGQVVAPTRLIVGSQDTIVPPGTSAGPMYANLLGPRQLADIVGGSHCGFIDSSIPFCDSGSISRATQLALTRALMLEFLALHLQGDGAMPWEMVWGPGAERPGVEVDLDARVVVTPATGEVAIPAGGSAAAVWTVSNLGPREVVVELRLDPAIEASITPASATIAAGGSAKFGVEFESADLPKPTVEVTISARRSDLARGEAVAVLSITPMLADLNGDGIVNGGDLSILLGSFGGPGPGDLNDDGVVDGTDLSILLGAWTS